MTAQVVLLSSNICGNPEPETYGQTSYVRFASDWLDMVKSAKSDDVELVLWKRSLTGLNVTNAEVEPESDLEVILGTRQQVLTELESVFVASAWPAPLRERAEHDARQCLNAFEAEFSGSLYRLRLEAVSDDACRKFHQDGTFQRLIITYRGNGTVWRDVKIGADRQAIEMECVLLRGKRAGRDPQILHRSPSFMTGQMPRLIMVIDVIPDR